MKKLLLSLLLVIFCNCKSAENLENKKNIKLIKNFCKDVLFVNNPNYAVLNKETIYYSNNQSPENKVRFDSISAKILNKENRFYNIYLNINPKKEINHLPIVNTVVIAFNIQLEAKKMSDYNITPFSKVSNFPNLDSSNFIKNIKYKDKTNLYFLHSEYEKNSPTFFIVEKGKIISFFPELDMRQQSENSREVTPYLLNK